MEKIIHTYELEWNCIKIEINFEPEAFSFYTETYGYPLAHLEVRSIQPEKAPLPFTGTGYRSHFFNPTQIKEFNDPVSYVRQWLDESAKSKDWIDLQESLNQMSLF